MAFLVVVPSRYLAYVFLRSILLMTKNVVIKDGIYQIYTCCQSTDYCMTRPLAVTIASGFLKVLIEKLDTYY